ncbi:MAG: hypothetical protein COA84_14935 [Robiginitomaculum sp.]|nr:MAG: hypothetical protein COA84_14935 [Robiginitomaculum sp.]
MATEKLIVQLSADTAQLDTALTDTDNKLDKLGGTTTKTDGKLSKFTSVAKGAAVALTAAAVAAAALITETVQYAKELTIATKRNGENIEKMQAWAFAANTVGVSLEKLGDIGKDTNEKVSEFIATGGGGFQDFADVMGLTGVEARALAKDFEEMSGTDVLQEMVRRMEEGGISAGQMSFALEGMASDTTDLIPLLKDGSSALKALTDDFDAMNVALTQEDINKITAVGIEFDKMTAKLSGESRQAVADYAEEIARAIKVTTEFLVTTGNVFSLIATGWGNILEISQAAVTDMVNGTDTLTGVLQERAKLTTDVINKLKEDVKKGAESIGKDLVIPTIADEDSAISSGGDDEDNPTIKKINREIEAIKDRFKTEQELLLKKFDEENALFDVEIENIAERDELKLQLLQEFEENTAAIKQKARDKEAEALKKEEAAARKAASKLDKDKRKLSKTEEKNAKQDADREAQFARDSMALAAFIFEDNKGVAAGIALMNTAQGVTKALASQDYAGAALTGVMGAAQIAAILGASKGGGSVPSVSSAPPVQSRDADFQQETSSLDFTDASASGSQLLNITVPDGDEIGAAVANWLKNAQITGNA